MAKRDRLQETTIPQQEAVVEIVDSKREVKRKTDTDRVTTTDSLIEQDIVKRTEVRNNQMKERITWTTRERIVETTDELVANAPGPRRSGQSLTWMGKRQEVNDKGLSSAPSRSDTPLTSKGNSQTTPDPNTLTGEKANSKHQDEKVHGQMKVPEAANERERSFKGKEEKDITRVDLPSRVHQASNRDSDKPLARNASQTISEPNSLLDQSASRRHKDAKVERKKAVPRKVAESERRAKGERIALSQYDLPSGLKSASNTDFDGPLERDISGTNSEPNSLHEQGESRRHEDAKGPKQKEGPRKAPDRDRRTKGERITRAQYDLPPGLQSASNTEFDSPLAKDISETNSEPNSLLEQVAVFQQALLKRIFHGTSPHNGNIKEIQRAKGTRTTRKQIDLPPGLKNQPNTDRDEPFARDILRVNSEPNSLHEQSSSRNHKDAKVERKKEVPRKVAESERSAKVERITRTQYDLPPGLNNASSTDIDGAFARDISRTDTEPNSLREQSVGRKHKDAKVERKKEVPRKVAESERSAKVERITRTQYDLPPGLNNASSTDIDGPFARDISRTDTEPNSLREQSVGRKHKDAKVERKKEVPRKVAESERSAKVERITRTQYDLPPGLNNASSTDIDGPFARDISRTDTEPNSLREQSVDRRHRDAKVERKKEVPRKVSESERSAKVERITRTQYDLPPGLNNASSTDIDGPFARDISRTDTEPNSLREQSAGRRRRDAKVERKKEVPRKVSESERSAKVERITRTQYDLPTGLNNASKVETDGPVAGDTSRANTEPNSLREQSVGRKHKDAKVERKKEVPRKVAESERSAKVERITRTQYDLPPGLNNASSTDIDGPFARDISRTDTEPNSLREQSVGGKHKVAKVERKKEVTRKVAKSERNAKVERITKTQYDLPPGLNNASSTDFDGPVAGDTSRANTEPNSLREQSVGGKHKVAKVERKKEVERITKTQYDLPPGLNNASSTDFDGPVAGDTSRANTEPNSLREQSVGGKHKVAKVERKKEVTRKVAKSERSAKVGRITKTQYDLPPGLNNASSTDFDGPVAGDTSRANTEPNSLREQSVGGKHKVAKVERKKEVTRKVAKSERNAKVERITRTQYDLPPGLNNASSTDIDGPFARDISRTDTEPNSLREQSVGRKHKDAKVERKKEVPRKVSERERSAKVERITKTQHDLPPGLNNASRTDIDGQFARDISRTDTEPNSLREQSVGRKHKDAKVESKKEVPRKVSESERSAKVERITRTQYDLPPGLNNASSTDIDGPFARDISRTDTEPNSLREQSAGRRRRDAKVERKKEVPRKVSESERSAKVERITRTQYDLPPGLNNASNVETDGPVAGDTSRANTEPNSLREQSVGRKHKDAKVERKKEVPRKVSERERSAKVERITKTQHDLPPGLNNASSTDIDGPFARDISRTDTEPNSLREQGIGRRKMKSAQHNLTSRKTSNASNTGFEITLPKDTSTVDPEPNTLINQSVKRRHEKRSKPVELQKESDSESVDKKRKTKAFTNVLYGLPYGLICVSNWAIERTLERDNSGTRSEPNSLIGQSVGRRLKNGKDRKHQNQPRKAQENEGISKGKRTTTAFTNSQHDLPFGMKNTPERLHEKLLARDTSLSEPNSLLNQNVDQGHMDKKDRKQKKKNRKALKIVKAAKEKRTTKVFMNVQHDLPSGLKNTSERDFKKSWDASETLSEPNSLANQSVSRKRDSEKRPEEVHREEPESKRSAKERRTSKAFLNVQHDLPSGLKNASERDFRKSMDVSETLCEPNYLANQSVSRKRDSEKGPEEVHREEPESKRSAKERRTSKAFLNVQHDLPSGLKNASERDFRKSMDVSETLSEPNYLANQSVSRKRDSEKRPEEVHREEPESKRSAKERRTSKAFLNVQHDLPFGLKNASERDFRKSMDVSETLSEPNYLANQSVSRKRDSEKRPEEVHMEEPESKRSAKERHTSKAFLNVQHDLPFGLKNASERDFRKSMDVSETLSEPNYLANQSVSRKRDSEKGPEEVHREEPESKRSAKERRTSKAFLNVQHDLPSGLKNASERDFRKSMDVSETLSESNYLANQSVSRKRDSEKRPEEVHREEPESKRSAKERRTSKAFLNVQHDLPFGLKNASERDFRKSMDVSETLSEPNYLANQSVSRKRDSEKRPEEVHREEPESKRSAKERRTSKAFLNVQHDLPFGLKNASERDFRKSMDVSETLSEPNYLANQSVSRKRDSEKRPEEVHREEPESKRSAKERRTSKAFLNAQHDLPSGLKNASERDFKKSMDASETLSEPNYLDNQSTSKRPKTEHGEMQQNVSREARESGRIAKGKPSPKVFMNLQHDLPPGLNNASKKDFERPFAKESSEKLPETNSLRCQSLSRRHKDEKGRKQQELLEIASISHRKADEMNTMKPFENAQHDLPRGLVDASKTEFKCVSGENPEPNYLTPQAFSAEHNKWKDETQKTVLPENKGRTTEKHSAMALTNVQHDLHHAPTLSSVPSTKSKMTLQEDRVEKLPDPSNIMDKSVCLKPEKAKEEPCKELNSVSTAKEKCVSTVCRSSRDEHAWVGQRFEEGKREVATKAEPKSVAENGTAAPPQDTDLKTAMNVLVETETAKADTDRVTTTDSLIENKMVKTTEVIGNQTRERITWTIRKRIVERTDEWKREPGTPGPRKSGQSITWKGKRKEKLLNKEELAKSSAEKKLSDVPSNLKRNLLFEPPPNMDFGTPLPNDSSAASSQPNSSIVQSVSSTHEHVRGPIQKEKPGQRPDNVDVSGKRTKSVLTNVLYGLPIGLKKATNWVMERPLAKGSSRTESEPNSLLSQSVSRRHKDAEVLIQKEKPRNMPESEGAREKKTTETFMSVQHDLPSGLEDACRRVFENQPSGTNSEPNCLLGQSVSGGHKDAEIPIQKEEPRRVPENEDEKEIATTKTLMSIQHDLPSGLEDACRRVSENQPSGTNSEPNYLLGQSVTRRHKDAEIPIQKEEPRHVPESEDAKEKPTTRTLMSIQHDLPIGLENASKRVFENQPSGTSSEPNSLLGQSISRRHKDAEVSIEKEEPRIVPESEDAKKKPTSKAFMSVQHDLPIGLENASKRVFENQPSGTSSEPNSLLGQTVSRRHKDAEIPIQKEEPRVVHEREDAKKKPTSKAFMSVQHDLPIGLENASKRVFENQPSGTSSEPNSLLGQTVSRRHKDAEIPIQKEEPRDVHEREGVKEKPTKKTFMSVQHDLPSGLENASKRVFENQPSGTSSEPNSLLGQTVSRRHKDAEIPIQKEEPRDVHEREDAKKKPTSKAFMSVQHDLPIGLENASKRVFENQPSGTSSEPNSLLGQTVSRRHKDAEIPIQKEEPRDVHEREGVKEKPTKKTFMSVQHDLPSGLENASRRIFENQSSGTIFEPNSLLGQSISRRHKDAEVSIEKEEPRIVPESEDAKKKPTSKAFMSVQHDLPIGLENASKRVFENQPSGTSSEPNSLLGQSISRRHKDAEVSIEKEEPRIVPEREGVKEKPTTKTFMNVQHDLPIGLENASKRVFENQPSGTSSEPNSLLGQSISRRHKDAEVSIEKEEPRIVPEREGVKEKPTTKTFMNVQHDLPSGLENASRRIFENQSSGTIFEPNSLLGQSISRRHKDAEIPIQKEEPRIVPEREGVKEKPTTKTFMNVQHDLPSGLENASRRIFENQSSGTNSEPNSLLGQSISRRHKDAEVSIEKEEPRIVPEREGVKEKPTTKTFMNVQHDLPIGLENASKRVFENQPSGTSSEPNSLLGQTVSRRHKDAEIPIQKEEPRDVHEREDAKKKPTSKAFMSVQHDLPIGLENASKRVFENQPSGTSSEPNSLLGQSISRRHKGAEVSIEKEEPRIVPESEGVKEKPTKKTFMSVQHDLPSGLENASRRIFENQSSGTISEPNSLLGQSISRRHKDAEVSIEKEEPRIVPEREGVKEKPTTKTFMNVQHDLPIGLENASKRVFENQPSGTSSEPNSLLGQSISRRYKDAEVPIEKEESKEKPTTKTFMNVQHDLPIGLENASRRVFENRSSGTNSEPNSLLGQSMSRRHKDAEVSIEKEEPKEKPTTKTFMNVQHDLPFGMENASKRVFENQSTGANSEPNSLFGQNVTPQRLAHDNSDRSQRGKIVPLLLLPLYVKHGLRRTAEPAESEGSVVHGEHKCEQDIDPERGRERRRTDDKRETLKRKQYNLPSGFASTSRCCKKSTSGRHSDPNSLTKQSVNGKKDVVNNHLEKREKSTLIGNKQLKERPKQTDLPTGIAGRHNGTEYRDRPSECNSLTEQINNRRPDKKRDEGTLQYKDRRKEHKKRKRPSVTCCRKRRAMKRAQREGQDLSRKEKFKETGGRRKNKKERHRSPRRAKDRSSRGTNDRYVPMSNAPSEQPDQPPRTASASRRSEPLSAKTPDEPNSLLEQNLDNEGDVAAPQRDEEPHMEHTKKNGPSLSCCCKRRATRRIAIRAGKEGKDIDTREGRGAMNRPPKSDDSSRREPSDKSRQKSKSSKNEEQNLPPGIASASRRGYKEALSRKGSKTPSEPNSLLEQKLHINPELAAIPHKEKRLKKHKEHKKNGRLSLSCCCRRRRARRAAIRAGKETQESLDKQPEEKRRNKQRRKRRTSLSCCRRRRGTKRAAMRAGKEKEPRKEKLGRSNGHKDSIKVINRASKSASISRKEPSNKSKQKSKPPKSAQQDLPSEIASASRRSSKESLSRKSSKTPPEPNSLLKQSLDKQPENKRRSKHKKRRRPSLSCCRRRRGTKRAGVRAGKEKLGRSIGATGSRGTPKSHRSVQQDLPPGIASASRRNSKEPLSRKSSKTPPEPNSLSKQSLDEQREKDHRSKHERKRRPSLSCCRRRRGMKRAAMRAGKEKQVVPNEERLGRSSRRKRSRRGVPRHTPKSPSSVQQDLPPGIASASRRSSKELLSRKSPTTPFDPNSLLKQNLDRQPEVATVPHDKRKNMRRPSLSCCRKKRAPEFQPHRKADRSKDGEIPSTAIDIDSSIRPRRRRTEGSSEEARGDRQKYSGELVKDKDEQYHVTKPPSDDAAFEPSIGRGSELVPLEDSIDPQYPAQRIVITSFVRNGCHIKRWLYEDSYPIGGVRPAIADLVCSGPRDMRCRCGRRSVCDRSCVEDFSAKRHSTYHNYDSERIRGELQRLDAIVKNLDD
ncbi:hypothetical protein Q1695_006118 [Nippostrongylus brasiliensis]|nr:hypothetical protein Q1695_006118 [Nippostrongylus brasiliensis]